jgi:hydroxymethylpyrimidine pyrophosphatase-like HAD family hydrolase
LDTFNAIASDYDSTLAHEGQVAPETLRVLQRARLAGRKLILVTGRTLDGLRTVFSEMDVFDTIVAENGAVIFDPDKGLEQELCAAPPPEFLAALSKQSVPFSFGKRVIATHRPHGKAVQQVINHLKVDFEITLNRDSVMVLPRGIDKASGLRTALDRMKIEPSAVVGIGDAENDIPFLRVCGFSAAVANAIDIVKRQAHYVTREAEGAGASEVIERVITGKSLVGAPVTGS